jgi:hypothetical protein
MSEENITRKPKIFISYSHADEEWKEFIKGHFTCTQKVEIWNDRDIKLGANWFDEIKNSLHEADIAILLISKNFLDSEFIAEEEIPDLLKRCKENKVTVISVMVKACAWKQVDWLSKKGESLQGYPKDFKPLNSFKKPHEKLDDAEALNEVVTELVNKVIEDFQEKIKLEEIINDSKKEFQFIADYIEKKGIKSDDLLDICKDFLDKNLYLQIKRYTKIIDIINHISDNKMFPSIINKVYQGDDEDIGNWLQSKQIYEAEENNNTFQPRLVIIFRHKEDEIYEVTFRSKDLPNTTDQNDSFDYDLKNEKEKLIEKIIDYIGNSNPQVDLVLPIELLNHDINLWEINFNESLSTLAKVNIIYNQRYNSDETFKKLYQNQWKNVLQKVENNKGLSFVLSENDIRNIGNNMQECGIASEFILEDKHFKYLLKTEMSYIMLWKTKQDNKDLSELCVEGIKNIRKKYYELNNKPINLMWDDPTSYYYSDEVN